MKNIRRIIFISCISALFVGGLVALLLYIKGDWGYEYDVQITNLRVCHYSAITNNYEPMTGTIQIQEIDDIYLCGSIQTKTKIVLVIVMTNEDEGEPIFIEDNQKFEKGDFHIKINFNNGKKPGEYLAQIYLFRNLLATYEFTIVDH